ncbi:MAG: flagellar hook-associated protein FlgL [Deltaproteobacteria bacterium]|nr:flagellar hook-associated protein FlgL [Deltaproteobacteria bacterium]
MRITSQTIARQVAEELQRAYQRVARAQEAVTSGRRINHLSDDPVGASRAMRLRGFEESLAQYQRNIDNGMPFLDQADSVLGDVTEGLTRAKELTLAMVNDTNSATERHAAAREIHQIFLQVRAEANTKVENRFLFGGFLNGSAPFVEGAARVDYLGDNGQITIQTNPTSTLAINLQGSAVFQGAGVVGGQGIFDVLQDLEAVLDGGAAANAITLGVNLDDGIAAGSGFSLADAVGTEAPPATFLGEANFSTAVTVFDAIGQAHNLTFLFAKTGATTFQYRVVADSDEITGGTPGNLHQVAPQGTLEFNADGTFNAAGSTLTNITLTGLTDGAADITIAAADLSFAGSTQLAAPSAVLTLTQTNTNGLHAQLGRLDAAIDQVLTFRAELGARLNGAKVAGDAAGMLKDRTLAQRSQIEDADALAAYSDFARYQHAFEAAIQSASRVIQPSLLDYLS